MDNATFQKIILEMPVWDCHTHLVGSQLNLKNIWDLAHYFWFHQELRAAGYPIDPSDFDPSSANLDVAMQQFLDAYRLTRNTAMNWCVTRILKDLYDVELTDLESVRRADQKIRQLAEDPAFSKVTLEKTNLKQIAVGSLRDADFKGLPNISFYIPRLDGLIRDNIKEIEHAASPTHALQEFAQKFDALFTDYEKKSVTAVTLAIPKPEEPCGTFEGFSTPYPSHAEVSNAVLHTICRLCEAHHFCLQLFMGMETGWTLDPSGRTAENDPTRIHKLYGLFENHPSCQFEIVCAAELNNLDIVHAAEMFPNVSAGGLWWYSYKPSVFRDAMQKRLESLPRSKCSLITSDSRQIQWCYGKIMLVKKILADFLWEQIQQDWLSEEDALDLANWWLYQAAAVRYQAKL
ncbi:MAG: hypothetical protein ACOX6P_03675 [Candidatus Merdivicinus sp.]